MITEGLKRHLSRHPSAPFLFVGSGLSRRYLGIDRWDDLLKNFCTHIDNYRFYYSKVNGDLPSVATLMASDFHNLWWKTDIYKDIREKTIELATTESSPLKIAISEYIESMCESAAMHIDIESELQTFKNVCIDGIITTNWDTFLEKIFQGYRPFIGQDELLFSNPQNIGEIYKIHGCTTKPNSLVLTKEDYENFEQTNPYLSAKLITIFVEHPVLFMGYSLTDPHLIRILSSLVQCLGSQNIERLQGNLIFIQRDKSGLGENLVDTVMQTDLGPLPITIARTNEFSKVYAALHSDRRKIPARILRYFKEQLFDLVKSNDPTSKISVIDIDDVEDASTIEFIVGIGATQILSPVSSIGYAAIPKDDLYRDLLHHDKHFDEKQILEITLPRISRKRAFAPVFMYLRKFKITTEDEYKSSGLKLDNIVIRTIDEYRGHKAYERMFEREIRGKMDTAAIISKYSSDQASILLPMLDPEDIDLTRVREFLIANETHLQYKPGAYSSYYRKLACYYDRIMYGWF